MNLCCENFLLVTLGTIALVATVAVLWAKRYDKKRDEQDERRELGMGE